MNRALLLAPALLSLAAASGQLVLPNGTALSVDAGTSLRVDAPISWSLATGSIMVNDGEIVFGPEAQLDESPGAAIMGLGTERTTRDLSAPLAEENPAGLGAIITTDAALGTTTIVRGHVPYTDYSGHTSIARWIDLSPSANTGLAATLGFRYDLLELNGVMETDQRLHVRAPQDIWWPLPSNVNTVERTVTTTGLDSLGLFTTFNEDLPNALPPNLAQGGFAVLGAPGGPLFLHVPLNERVGSLELVAPNGATVFCHAPSWSAGQHALPALGTASGLYLLRVNGRHTFTLLQP